MQDIVNLSTEKVEGFEALMRLKVDDELLPASRFINIAEDMGLIQKLDIAMIEGLFQKIASVKDKKDILLFINLSPQDLTDDFIKDVVQRAKTYGVETARIVFEITEREAIQDIGRMSSFLKGLKEACFRFAIDDVGSGYAFFLYLKYLPVDFLKIVGMPGPAEEKLRNFFSKG